MGRIPIVHNDSTPWKNKPSLFMRESSVFRAFFKDFSLGVQKFLISKFLIVS
jgi:hypothetical protein